MSGIAKKLANCDFSLYNLGTITQVVQIFIEGLSIDDSVTTYSGYKLLLNVNYTPDNTTQRSIVWEITSGTDYATIDENGLLNILSTANNSEVIVKATSEYNTNIYDEITLNLTYVEPVYYNITYNLDNALSSNTDSLIISDELYVTTLTNNGGRYSIKDITVTMNNVDVTSSENVSIVENILSEGYFSKSSYTITISNLTGDINISNSSLIEYVLSLSVLMTGSIIHNVGKLNANKNNAHYYYMIPCVQGDVIKVYFPPTNNSAYTSTWDSTYLRYFGTQWAWKAWEINTTDETKFNASKVGLSVSLYLTEGISQSMISTFILDHQSSMTGTYTVLNSSTVAVYFLFGMGGYPDASSSWESIPMTSSATTYNTSLYNSTLTGSGLILSNAASDEGKGAIKLTINEDIEINSLSIDDSVTTYSGETLQLSINYDPVNTTQSDVIWEITSGTDYATIDENGLLNILSTANNSEVIVKATSEYNTNIYDEITLNLTYAELISYTISYNLADNTSSSNVATSINSGQSFTTDLLSTSTSYDILDISVIMGNDDISSSVIAESSPELLNRKTYTITIPEVTGNIQISNTRYYSRILNSNTLVCGCIGGTGKLITTNKYFHSYYMIPCVQGDTLKIYFPPMSSDYIASWSDDLNDYIGYKWQYKAYEINTTDETNFKAANVNTSITSYLTIGTSLQNIVCPIINSNSITESSTYTIQNSNTVAVYILFSMVNVDSIGTSTSVEYSTSAHNLNSHLYSVDDYINYGTVIDSYGDDDYLIKVTKNE